MAQFFWGWGGVYNDLLKNDGRPIYKFWLPGIPNFCKSVNSTFQKEISFESGNFLNILYG